MKFTTTAALLLGTVAAFAASAQTPNPSETKSPPSAVGTPTAPRSPSTQPSPNAVGTNSGPSKPEAAPSNAMGTDSGSKPKHTHKKKPPADQPSP